MTARTALRTVSVFVLAAVTCGLAACTDGTTPVCDDAGTCLIGPAGGAGGGGDAGAADSASPPADAASE